MRRLLGFFRFAALLMFSFVVNRISRKTILGSGDVIVSLTTHGDRIDQVYLTLESISRGRVRARRVTLWLDTSFRNRIPSSLERLQKRGLEIFFVDDVGPHQKFFYAKELALSDGVPLVTIDDDCLYWSWWLERLIDGARKTPDNIVCYRARRLLFDGPGSLKKYNVWPLVDSSDPSPDVFITGVSGVIYPTDFLQELSVAGDNFKNVCPKADDVWLNYIASKSRKLARQLEHGSWDFPVVPKTQNMALWAGNSDGGNDVQLNCTYDADTLDWLYQEVSLKDPPL